MKYVVWALAVALFILHQDFWLWDDHTLMFGFLPIGLAYHIGFSIASSLLWGLAIIFAWPKDIEEFASEFDQPAQSAPPQTGPVRQ
jgi:hypothetical protein